MNDESTASKMLRKPPHSASAEQSVLGSLLIDSHAWSAVADVVIAEAFFEPRHRLIFAAIAHLSERHSAVDVITVAEELKRAGDSEKVGGLAYLGKLAENTPSTNHVRAYAELVRAHAERRELIRIATAASDRGYRGDEPADIMSDTEAGFLALSQRRSDSGPRSFAEILRDGYVEELKARAEGRARGLPTGFVDLDRSTNGLRPGQLIVVAARPGQGKTVLAANIAEHVAVKLHQPTLFFSLEMSDEELRDRFVSSLSGIPLEDIQRGEVSDPAFLSATKRLHEAPLHIDDTPALYATQIRARSLRVKRQHGLALVVVETTCSLFARKQRDATKRSRRSLVHLRRSRRNCTARLSRCHSLIEKAKKDLTRDQHWPICASPVRSNKIAIPLR